MLNSSLHDADRLLREDGDVEYIDKLSLWISKAMLPDGALVPQDEMAEGK